MAKFRVQKEDALIGYLSQNSVQVFAPEIVSPGHDGTQMEALFPTYLFCYFDPESRAGQMLRRAPGMSHFLGCDGEPALMPEELIDYLRERVTQWNQLGYSRQLSSGDTVVVTEGPFAGFEGIFQRYIPSKQRCRILLEVVGRLTSVELPEWEVNDLSSRD